MIRYLLVAALFLAAACAPSGEDDARGDALVEAVAAGRLGEALDLVQILGDDWDRMAVFGPYYDNDVVKDELGFGFNYEGATEWVDSEGGWLVVLASDRQAIAWFKIRYEELDVGCLDGLVLEASDSSAAIGEDPDGKKILGPIDRPNCYFW